MLLLEIAVFGFALWLGLYLISRNWHDARLLLAGLGLAGYALALAIGAVAGRVPESVTAMWQNAQRPFLLVPILCWVALLGYLWRGDESLRTRWLRHPRPLAARVTREAIVARLDGYRVVAGYTVDGRFLLLGQHYHQETTRLAKVNAKSFTVDHAWTVSGVAGWLTGR